MIKCRMYLEKHRVRVRALAKAISNWSKSRLNNCVPVSLSVGAGQWLRFPGQGFSWLSNPSTLVTRLRWGQGIPPKGLVVGEENLSQLLLSVDGKNMPKHRFFCLMLEKKTEDICFPPSIAQPLLHWRLWIIFTAMLLLLLLKDFLTLCLGFPDSLLLPLSEGTGRVQLSITAYQPWNETIIRAAAAS